MKFFNIVDTPEFLRKVLDCKGNVYCKDADGKLLDFKQTARLLSAYNWLIQPKQLNEIDLIVEQNADFRLLFRYMQESACAR